MKGAARGFTLIELLAVTAIIIIVSTIVLANNNSFGGKVQLENLAYDIALSVRQAQVYGISVERSNISSVCSGNTQQSNFCGGYGLHFDSSNSDSYIFFVDALSQNGLYDCPEPGTNDCELVQSSALESGYLIKSLCATPSSGGGETCGLNTIDIVFERPEPDAWISGNGASCLENNGNCEESASIQLVSPRGDLMSVVIDSNGQISVENGAQ